jgi:hypothetical protein
MLRADPPTLSSAACKSTERCVPLFVRAGDNDKALKLLEQSLATHDSVPDAQVRHSQFAVCLLLLAAFCISPRCAFSCFRPPSSALCSFRWFGCA